MKSLVLFTLIFLTGNSIAGKVPSYAIKKINKYIATQEVVTLPTNFAQPFIISNENLNFLKDKKITHIDLVYTEYKESESFDQNALNASRIEQLKKVVPQSFLDHPTWSWYEQSGAKTRDVANDYFHGFVIYYQDKVNYSQLKGLLRDETNQLQKFTVTNEKGTVINFKTGTKIHVPANAVTTLDGKKVVGEYSIEYREFRNSAEMALSGIPMVYNSGNESYNFSSIGMYEIRGSQNGEELKLQKDITVDFNATKQVKDAFFFDMNDKGEWKKQAPIVFEIKNNQVIEKNEDKNPEEQIPMVVANNNVALFKRDGEQGPKFDHSEFKVTHHLDKNGNTVMSLTKNAWLNYEFRTKDSLDLRSKAIIESNAKKRELLVDTEYAQRIINLAIHQNFVFIMQGDFVPGKPVALLGQGSTDPGHTYPNLVRQLNSKSFGVYNCDQIYTVKNQQSIAPNYVCNGKPIIDGSVACLIDKELNGSFSFDPRNITYNGLGKNAILLFTKSNQVYLINEDEFAKINAKESQHPTVSMINVTDKVKSSDDLAKLLNI